MLKSRKRYMEGVKSLYGDTIELKVHAQGSQQAESRHEQKNEVLSEDQEQIILATWLTKKDIPFYHVPNGGRRNYVEAIKFKRMGVSPGVPDICIPKARKGCHSLYIELKRVSGGRLSEAQLFWRKILLLEGHAWFEAKGASAAIAIIEDYLY